MSMRRNDADACVSLRYKYHDMISCVKGQRPALLSDPILNTLAIQIEALEKAFEARVYNLSGESYDDAED